MKIRYSKPTRFDKGEFGDICKVISSEKKIYYCVQIEEEPEKYNWVPLGEFFELAFEKFIHNKEFFNKCLKLVTYTIRPGEFDYINQKNSEKILKEIL